MEAAVAWLRLSEATTFIDHDVSKARERLERAISKAWQMGPSGQPQAMSDPNIPLRVLVKSPPGLRIMGRAWLEKPVLHWDTSEIDCIGKPWAPSSQQSSSAQAIQFLASIEVWDEDLVRLWGNERTPVVTVSKLGKDEA